MRIFKFCCFQYFKFIQYVIYWYILFFSPLFSLPLSNQNISRCLTSFAKVIAGSETTATLMTGALYLITRHPEVQRKLEHEIRSTFKSEDEILLNTVNELPYMLAVLNESLRRYPTPC